MVDGGDRSGINFRIKSAAGSVGSTGGSWGDPCGDQVAGIDAGYHVLTATELKALAEQCQQVHIPVGRGDVLFFVGGAMVHESPPVQSGAATRYMTYAHWALSAGGSET